MSNLRPDESSYYEILEVGPAASGREIHAAYLRAKETYSPDSPALYTMFSPEEARELLKLIEEAFSVLSNSARRSEYDLGLARKGHPAFAELLRNAPEARLAGRNRSENPRTTGISQSTTSAPSTSPRLIGEEGAVVKPSRGVGGLQRDELPEGYARTRFGVYEVDKAFEHDVANVTECDGSLLQKIRLYKKINLDQLSDSTRISKSFLSAIESNAFEALPAPVFVRGFVVQMARTLGMNDKVLADAYMKFYRKQNGV